MDIKSIEIKDTNGSLKEVLWKNTPQYPSVEAYLEMDKKTNKQVVNILPGNVNFVTAGGNINNGLTYQAFLTYNGTLATKNKLFKKILVDDRGVFYRDNIPVMQYSPDGVAAIKKEDLGDSIIDLSIKMYSGVVDVLEYREGDLTRGEKKYNLRAVHNYPMVITEDVNSEKDVVFLDGWYTYTFIIFRDIKLNDTIVKKDWYYSYKGMTFKASADGIVEDINGSLYVYKTGTAPEDGEPQKEYMDYMDLRAQLESRDGVGDNYNHSYVETQLLITDEVRDAITDEIMCSICKNDTGCAFADWQVLTLKRQAAAIMFWNELYRNAQTIIESTRKMCHPKYREECS